MSGHRHEHKVGDGVFTATGVRLSIQLSWLTQVGYPALVTAPQSQYDAFSEIYGVWTDTAPSAQANLFFYVNAYLRTDGPVVELGVGDGRIAVEAATRGCKVVGVDVSRSMLDLCRSRAARAGVSAHLDLLEADFRTFTLEHPAALVALPYHSMGHLLSFDEKLEAVAHIYSQLRPGGEFVFDDFLMTPALLAHMRRVQLRAEYRSPAGTDSLLWVTSLVDEASQSMRVVTWEDQVDTAGLLTQRRYRRLSLSWLEPAQWQELLTRVGFVVDACYGSFDGEPFALPKAREQIWRVRRPA